MKTDTQDKNFAFRVNAQNNNQSPVIVSSGCCLYEECNKNPCDQFGQGTVCTEMASCQSNKCNKDYATAIASHSTFKGMQSVLRLSCACTCRNGLLLLLYLVKKPFALSTLKLSAFAI